MTYVVITIGIYLKGYFGISILILLRKMDDSFGGTKVKYLIVTSKFKEWLQNNVPLFAIFNHRNS